MRLPSRESPLTSPLHQLLIPLSLVIFPLTFSSPLPPFYLFSPSAFLSARLLVFSGMPVRLGGEESANAKPHKMLAANTKSCCGDGGQICLNWICSLSPLLVFIIFFSLSWPVVHPSVAFSTLPYCESHFSPLLTTQVFSLLNFYNRSGGITDNSDI